MMREKLEALAKEWDENYDPYVMMDPTSHLHAEAIRAILDAEPESEPRSDGAWMREEVASSHSTEPDPGLRDDVEREAFVAGSVWRRSTGWSSDGELEDAKRAYFEAVKRYPTPELSGEPPKAADKRITTAEAVQIAKGIREKVEQRREDAARREADENSPSCGPVEKQSK